VGEFDDVGGDGLVDDSGIAGLIPHVSHDVVPVERRGGRDQGVAYLGG